MKTYIKTAFIIMILCTSFTIVSMLPFIIVNGTITTTDWHYNSKNLFAAINIIGWVFIILFGVISADDSLNT